MISQNENKNSRREKIKDELGLHQSTIMLALR